MIEWAFGRSEDEMRRHRVMKKHTTTLDEVTTRRASDGSHHGQSLARNEKRGTLPADPRMGGPQIRVRSGSDRRRSVGCGAGG